MLQTTELTSTMASAAIALVDSIDDLVAIEQPTFTSRDTTLLDFASEPFVVVDRAGQEIKRDLIDGADVLLTARAECYHVGHPNPLRESVLRLQAYADAGADVLFAPGPQTGSEIEALVAAVAPKPLNLLVVRDIGLRMQGIAELGVRRISLGGALALAAWTGLIRAAQILREGSFAALANLVPYIQMNELFTNELA